MKLSLTTPRGALVDAEALIDLKERAALDLFELAVEAFQVRLRAGA